MANPLVEQGGNAPSTSAAAQKGEAGGHQSIDYYTIDSIEIK
jgi:hypothetical protein